LGVEALVGDTVLTVVGEDVLFVGAVELPAGLGVGVPVEIGDDGELDVVVLGLLVDGTVEVTGGEDDVLGDLFGVVGDADDAGDFDDD